MFKQININNKVFLLFSYIFFMICIYCCLLYHNYIGEQHRTYLIDYYFFYVSLIYITIAVLLYLLIHIGEKLISYVVFFFYNLFFIAAWIFLMLSHNLYISIIMRYYIIVPHYAISNVVLGVVLVMFVRSAIYHIKRRNSNKIMPS